MNLSDAVSRKRGDYNNICGEDISQIGLESHDAVIECIRTSTSPRDISLPQRGDRRIFRRNEDRSQSGYENPGYTCIADDVYGGILGNGSYKTWRNMLIPHGIAFSGQS